MKILLVGTKGIVEDARLKSFLIQKSFGEKKNSKLILSLEECAYLAEKKKATVVKKGKKLSFKEIIATAKVKNFLDRYLVFKDLRQKDYVVKTGLKFGFDFRVYPKGKKIGEAHTEFVVAVKPQHATFTPAEFARKVRMAQTLNTKLLIAIVDSEGDINYYLTKREKL